jgi:hypothetical protein
MSRPAATTSPLAAVVGWGSIALGVIGVIGFFTGLVFGPRIPDVIRFANLGAAVMEAGLGAGVLARRRAAWAFLVTAECTVSLINLFALPDIVRSGGAPMLVAAAFAVLRLMNAVLLIVLAPEIPGTAPSRPVGPPRA